MKITFNVEVTEKELAAAMLPNGGKITNITVETIPTRTRRAAKTTTQAMPVKKTTRTQKKAVTKTKASS